ncbi:MAG: T9SS type A sorting domain-containing protein, partial [Ignavibacteria bacterium]|nr:T9SS type A sorting domain-containing protein [Ignavibacteria bacterium]
SWSWNFTGGTPTTSIDSIPKIIYNTAGTFPVSLAASNNIGSNTITTQNNYVVVLPTSSQYSATDLSESFETGTFPNSLWTVYNSNGIGWFKTTSIGYTGTSCLKLNNASNLTGSVDEFISATYDFSTISNPSLYFRMAFAKKSTSGSDALKVFVSIDCGKTWKLKYSKSGNGLATVAINTGTFTPASQTDWRLEKVNLSAYTGMTNVRFKFQFNYQSGNNLYIDDINFGQVLSVDENLNRAISFSVFPNPATGNRFGVSFNLEENSAVKISLINVEGKIIELLNQTLQAGHQLLYFNPATVASGIYFIRIEDEKNNSYTQRIILD